MTTPTPRTESDEDRANLARGEIPSHIAMPSHVVPTPLTDELLATARTKKLLSSDPRLPWYRLAAKLERDLAAAKEARQAAEALAESNARDAQRYRWLREPQDHICVSVEKRDWDIDEMFWTNEFEALVRAELDAAIDAAQEALRRATTPVANVTLSGDAQYWQERAQRAEALAESNARDAERYRWSKKLRPQPLWDGIPMKLHYMASMSEDAIDAAIDATMDAAAISAIAEGK